MHCSLVPILLSFALPNKQYLLWRIDCFYFPVSIIEDGSVAYVLQEALVPLVNTGDCNSAYGGQITDNMICAGYQEGGIDSCQVNKTIQSYYCLFLKERHKNETNCRLPIAINVLYP